MVQALTLSGYEGLKSLSFAAVATPEPGPNDVLVKIKSASVNPVDTKIARWPWLYLTAQAADGARPRFRGLVVKVGSAVTNFKAGDEVYGVADPNRWGTFAEFALMPAATPLALRPKSL